MAMVEVRRVRPALLRSTTTRLETELGSLYVTVAVDGDGSPFEVFAAIGKGGSFQHGASELACRLISLLLRRGAPLGEIIGQCQGIAEMQPVYNQMAAGRSIKVLGLGDGIAHVLRLHLPGEAEQGKDGGVDWL